jgi:triosephosphate isomerase
MYKTVTEAIELANGLNRELYELDYELIDVVLCPPYTALTEVSEVIADSGIQLGAQDCHWQEEGAFTGEVSCKMLRDAGCKFVIIGHSERRQYFGETNETVNKKIKAALKTSLTPIICVGETLDEREKAKTFEVLDEHIKNGLENLSQEELLKIVLAYEPVWAIGTGKTATPEQAGEAQKYIRDLLAKLYNKDIAENIRIQYGGSVKPENIAELMKQADVDGALVGGASLELATFSQIVKKAFEVSKDISYGA